MCNCYDFVALHYGRQRKMCNCYDDLCFRCGQWVPMHLEDFDTDPGELRTVCVAPQMSRPLICGGAGDIKFAWIGYTEVSFLDDRDGHQIWRRIRIYSLTRNAWSHRTGNLPNCPTKDIVYCDNLGQPNP